jgi:hypothetical protein
MDGTPTAQLNHETISLLPTCAATATLTTTGIVDTCHVVAMKRRLERDA